MREGEKKCGKRRGRSGMGVVCLVERRVVVAAVIQVMSYAGNRHITRVLSLWRRLTQ